MSRLCRVFLRLESVAQEVDRAGQSESVSEASSHDPDLTQEFVFFSWEFAL